MRRPPANVYAVILAGGSGERLWPLSTDDRPKQFVDVFGGRPLIAHAFDRLAGLVPPERTFVITAARLVSATRRALPGLPKDHILGEPARRNTAAAMAVAAGLVRRLGGPDAVACVLTADHLIEPVAKFQAVLADAARAAAATDSIVTMGIRPDRPSPEFGYIECAARRASVGVNGTKFRRVQRFVEKPDVATARRYLTSGRFLWNSGMFVWKVVVMEKAFAACAPDIGSLIDAVARAKSIPSALKRLYADVRSTSIDYAVMEKTRDILVAEANFSWDDVGSWLSVVKRFAADGAGNVRIGKTALVDTSDALVISHGAHVTAVAGLKGVVVIETPEATLVCAKSALGRMRELVAAAKSAR